MESTGSELMLFDLFDDVACPEEKSGVELGDFILEDMQDDCFCLDSFFDIERLEKMKNKQCSAYTVSFATKPFSPAECIEQHFKGKIGGKGSVPSEPPKTSPAVLKTYTDLASVGAVSEVAFNKVSLAQLEPNIRMLLTFPSDYPICSPLIAFAEPVQFKTFKSATAVHNYLQQFTQSWSPAMVKNLAQILQNLFDVVSHMLAAGEVVFGSTSDEAYANLQDPVCDFIKDSAVSLDTVFPSDADIVGKLTLPGTTPGAVNDATKTKAATKKSCGTGYSSGGISAWKFVSRYETSAAVYRKLCDSVENNTLSATDEADLDVLVFWVLRQKLNYNITLDEFFQNTAYYHSIIDLSIALTSITMEPTIIEALKPLLEFYEKALKPMWRTLESTERKVGYSLELLWRRAKQSTNASAADISLQASSESKDNIHELKEGEKAGTDLQLGPTIPCTDRVVEIDTPFEKHLFLKDMKNVAKLPAKWYKRLRMELNTMTESLPSSVQVFTGVEASQPNLMKVLMYPESIDCPYYGGAFEFDVFIPAEYPTVPPKVLLVTTGYGSVRFNPNLYECGKVCLSLLGTWSGEPWNPAISNLTQVFNSILFLVFVDDPYFNEPGYQSSKGSKNGDSQSNRYNERIRVATLQYAYLEHFKTEIQLSPYIRPVITKNWLEQGREVARKWSEDNTMADSAVTKVSDLLRQVDTRCDEWRGVSAGNVTK